MTGSCLGEPFLEHAELTLTTDKPARTGHWISRTVSRRGSMANETRRQSLQLLPTEDALVSCLFGRSSPRSGARRIICVC